jgi:hypothetical protein
MNQKQTRLGVAFAMVMTMSAMASASPLVFNFNTVVSGATPVGTMPIGTATFSDVSAGVVDMVLAHSVDSAQGQFFSRLNLNLSSPINNLTASAIGGEVATFGGLNSGSTTDAGSTYDMALNYGTSNASSGVARLEAGESVTIRFAGTGLSAQSFYAFSSGGNPQLALLHVQGIAGGGSSKVGAEAVPEPATMLVLSGIAALVSARKRRS